MIGMKRHRDNFPELLWDAHDKAFENQYCSKTGPIQEVSFAMPNFSSSPINHSIFIILHFCLLLFFVLSELSDFLKQFLLTEIQNRRSTRYSRTVYSKINYLNTSVTLKHNETYAEIRIRLLFVLAKRNSAIRGIH